MRTDGAVVEVDVICVILCLPLICRCQSSVSDSLLTAQTGKESLGAECFTHTLDSTIYSLFLPLSFSLALSLCISLSPVCVCLCVCSRVRAHALVSVFVRQSHPFDWWHGSNSLFFKKKQWSECEKHK